MDLTEKSTADGVRHPWERYRFDFYKEILTSAFDGTRISVLDVGAGDGWLAHSLRAAWDGQLDIVLWDSGYDEELVDQVGASCVKCQPTQTFDLVLMLDVAEHVSDDLGFLRDVVQRNLAVYGRLLFSVPSYMWLWTTHDERLRHKRRYSPKQARSLLERAGLRVLRSGGLFPMLLLVRTLQMVRERILKTPVPGLDTAPLGALAMSIEIFMELDNKIASRASKMALDIPGISWWALCAR